MAVKLKRNAMLESLTWLSYRINHILCSVLATFLRFIVAAGEVGNSVVAVESKVVAEYQMSSR